MNIQRVSGCKSISTCIIITLICMLTGTQVIALSGDYTITQVTTNTVNEYDLWMNSAGQVTWYGSDGTDSEIYFWDGTSIIQVSNNTRSDIDPQINAAGQITWRSYIYGTNSSEIYFWDGANAIQISNTSSSNYSPQINAAGQVTWHGFDGTNNQIFFWDGINITQITDNVYNDSYPNINAAGQVTWYRNDGTDREIFFWDGTNTTQITDNTTDDYSPIINNSGQLAWSGNDGTDTEIFFWDGTNITQITDNASDDWAFAINAAGTIAGITNYGPGTFPDYIDYIDIYYWDGVSINYVDFTAAYAGSFDLQMNDSGQMVWYDLSSPSLGEEISVWDGTSTFQLTSNNSSDWHPQINNIGQIAWVGIPDSESDLEVLLATPTIPLLGPLIAHYPFNGNANDISGYGLDGNIIGGASFTTGAAGYPNSAIALDGVDDNVHIPHEWAFDLEAFTLAATIQVPDYTNESWLISKGPNYGNYTLSIFDSTHPFFPGYVGYAHSSAAGNYSSLFVNGPVPTGNFFNLAITQGGGEFRSYFNGELISAYSSVPTPLLNDLPVTIGSNFYSGTPLKFFKGDIDDLRVYNTILSGTEIRDIHDTPPIADAGPDQVASTGQIVSLNGNASYDPDGHTPLSYSWAMVSSPAGSSATLSDPSAVGSSFITDLIGDYSIQLIVTDRLGLAGMADTVVITANPPPLSITGIWPATATVGENVSVFIFGSAFTIDNTTDVYFNGVPQIFVAPVSEAMLIVRLSPVTAGLFGPVTVTTPSDSVTSTIEFGAPQAGLSITGLWPSTAPIGISSSVFIFGTEFTIDGSTEVYFNGVRQFLVAPVSEEMLIVRVLGDASLSGPVQVVTPAGSVTSTDTLTFVP